jgi:NAD+ kinase
MSLALHFFASGKPAAQAAMVHLIARYGQCNIATADCVVAIGGDGTTLRALSAVLPYRRPVFALRLAGSFGFIGNIFRLEELGERIAMATRVALHPLRAEISGMDGQSRTATGLNEVVLVRQGPQAVKLRVAVDSVEQAFNFEGDGVLVATALGSMAYNRSAGGPALKFGSNLLALTALLPCRAADGLNQVIADRAIVTIEVLEPDFRRAKVEAGQTTIVDVQQVRIARAEETLTLLFDSSERRVPDLTRCLPRSGQ